MQAVAVSANIKVYCGQDRREYLTKKILLKTLFYYLLVFLAKYSLLVKRLRLHLPDRPGVPGLLAVMLPPQAALSNSLSSDPNYVFI